MTRIFAGHDDVESEILEWVRPVFSRLRQGYIAREGIRFQRWREIRIFCTLPFARGCSVNGGRRLFTL